MEGRLEEHYLEETLLQFRKLKEQADKALAQASSDDFFATLDPESNSLAVIVKHVGGNLRSRWTDFLTADGEKPDRDRDGEFEIRGGDTQGSLMAQWESGWQCVFDTIGGLTPRDLSKTVLIRREPHSVIQAISRSFGHTAGHVGQIVYVAKHLRWQDWKTLTVPRGKSKEFNAKMTERFKTKTG
jgi:hypothetical protein